MEGEFLVILEVAYTKTISTLQIFDRGKLNSRETIKLVERNKPCPKFGA